MRRPPILLLALLAALIPLALVLGIFLGSNPRLLPGPLRDAVGGGRDGRTLAEALDAIQSDYYRPVPRSELVNLSLGGAVRGLRDQFSNYYDPSSYRQFQSVTQGSPFGGVGISVEPLPGRGLRVSDVLPGTPAQRAGVRTGDIVQSVDGRSITALRSPEASAKIKGRPGTSVTLGVRSGAKTRTVRVKRAQIKSPLVRSRTLTYKGRKLGYVSLAQFSSGAHAEVRQAVDRQLKAGAAGVILDLRDNPGGLLDEAWLVGSQFIPDGPIVSTAGRTRGRHTYTATGGAISGRVRMTVLVDGHTASAAEIVSGALQDRHRARVVGTHTFGKGVFQEVRPLPNGGALDITVGEYFLPSGRNLGAGGVRQGAGVRPDVLAPADPKTPGDDTLRAAERVLVPAA